jgi:hypothetical protein
MVTAVQMGIETKFLPPSPITTPQLSIRRRRSGQQGEDGSEPRRLVSYSSAITGSTAALIA